MASNDIEEIITEQNINAAKLQQAISNYKKSPIDRKTLAYIDGYLKEINGLWNKFERLDKRIRSDKLLPENHSYYVEDIYAAMGKKYSEIRSKMEAELNELRKPDSQPSTSKVTIDENFVSELQKEKKMMEAIIRMIEQILHTSGCSIEFYKTKLRTVEQHYEHVITLHKKIWTNAAYNDEAYLQMEDRITNGIIKIQEHIALGHPVSVTTESQQSNNVPSMTNSFQLPKIELPKFDGNYLTWRNFFDLFTELVDKRPLSPCQKLLYLKSSLTGEAAGLIHTFATTAENYEIAWLTLQNRYENKRVLVNALLKKLLAQPPAASENVSSLKQLHDTTQECLHCLNNLGVVTHNWDPIMLHILLQRVHKQTHVLWEQSLVDPQALPKLQDFLNFIKTRFQSLEALGDKSSQISNTNSKQIRSFGVSIQIKEKCIICQQAHALFACQAFLKMTPKERLNAVQKAKHCVNCMKSGHNAKSCNSSVCTKCGQRHNTLLHLGLDKNDRSTTSNMSSSASGQANTQVATTAVHPQKSTSTLLSTAFVLVTDVKGTQLRCRALLDSGSQANFISKGLFKKLGFRPKSSMINIEGIGQTKSQTVGRINIEIASTTTGFKQRIEAHVLPKIISAQPTKELNINSWEIPSNIQLADVKFAIPAEVDLLIGAGAFYSILSIGQISLGSGCPILQNTLLGWIVGGEYNSNYVENSVHCGVGSTSNLEDKLENFWKIEEFENCSKSFTAAEMRCEQHFLQHIRKHNVGHYLEKLPFIMNSKKLGESKDIALQRFKAVERKLQKNPELRTEYIKFMREYESLGHMQEIAINDIPNSHYFLPHHAVFKMDSTTTKTRVVFDASSKTSSNLSLNDILATGPSVQSDVFTTILRFRFPRFAFTADVEKMYRQIWVNGEDRKFQLIWWRENAELPLRCMELKTVTYGTTCAPYLATRTLQYIAETDKHSYPLAAATIKNNFYVDDVMTGADKITVALELQQQLRDVLKQSGLNLRKWCSNDERLLSKIPLSDREISLDITGSTEENIKTMGITWFPKKDVFTIKITQENTNRITKRTALADISRLFDPLGLVAPIVVTAKIFLQQLWKLKLDWDAALPQELHSKWLLFRTELELLQKIDIPRHIFNHSTPKLTQLHIFADASEAAYGAAAYVRSIDCNNTILVRLLCSKSKVAPVKQLTLPRLELCAAKLASDLAKRLKEDKILPDSEIFFWSDSMVVINWIHAASSNYHTFVANRISAIQQVSSAQQWHHVRSDQNPADMISRGLTTDKLINNVQWFYGPLFLHGPMTAWPLQPPHQQCHLELRQKIITTTAVINPTESVFQVIRHQNSLFRLQRIMAYVYRFITNARQKHPKIINKITEPPVTRIPNPTEMENGLMILIRLSQKESFAEEIKELKKDKSVHNTSNISSLLPFLDDKGLIRVGGRLQASNLPFDARHQLILAHNHPLTKIIFTNLHKQNLHVGAQALLSIMRQRFWPLKGKNLARSTIQGCVFCTRARPKLFEQLMGALPKDRVHPARPFLTAGVDFFGPVWVHLRIRGKQPLKAYVAVFCCFTTKAVHLELVSDLSTDAFLGALRRFMARRGNCNKLYCDNATNFVGASNQLQELQKCIFENAAQQKIHRQCSERNVEFSFIPPRAPHFGGLWEAAVKSAKHLLQSTLSSANLTREEMETLLAEAEAIMNSRPLTPISSDPRDFTALTPGHFLIGEPLTSTADPFAKDPNLKPVTRWKVITQLKLEFWKRWTNEYLHTLQHRYKWKQAIDNIKPNTMVLIKEDNLPSLKWSIGRIQNVIRGNDGHVRVADVKTANNVIRRPITKLAPLPIDSTETDNSHDVRRNEEPRKSKRLKLTSSLPALFIITMLFLPLCFATNVKTKDLSDNFANTLGCLSTTIFVIIQFTLPYTTSTTVTFTPLEGDPGIYFERLGMAHIISSNWQLINVVNLKPIQKEAELTNTYITVLIELCSKLEVEIYCNKTIQHFQQHIETIEINNQLILNKHRSKRGAFNFVGNVASHLFGLLDSDYAEVLANNFEKLKSNDELLKRHIQNQTIFLDRTLNIIKKNQHQIEDEFSIIEKVLHNTSNRLTNVTAQLHLRYLSSTFNEIALLAHLQISRVESIQKAIIDIITDSHHGALSPELLTPKELQAELSSIDNHIKRTVKLPVTVENITEYYRIMTISHQISKDYLIFQIVIPLTSVKQYELLKLTAIPWFKNNTAVKLTLATNHLLIDMLREDHFSLTDQELHNCVIMTNSNYLCHQSQPIYNQNSSRSQCEVSILKSSKVTGSCSTTLADEGTFWNVLQDPNTWLYSIYGKEQIHTVCDNNPTQFELSGLGIMTINEGCIMKTKHVKIEGQGTITKVRKIVYAPTWKLSQPNATLKNENYKFSLSYHTSYDAINDLKTEIHQIKTISLNTIRPHDVHHYGLGYTMTLLVIICIVGIARLYWKQRRSTKLHHPKPSPRSVAPDVDVESQFISISSS